jgi:DNA-binding NarL/FixJ family response regulator
MLHCPRCSFSRLEPHSKNCKALLSMTVIKPKTTSSQRKRILIVDDHPVVRDGLVQQLGREPDLEVCAQAGSASQAIEGVEKMKPDLVLADINLPGRSGLELIREVRALAPEIPVLVLSMHDESVFAERVLRAGGRGYVSKQAGPEKLAAAIRIVLGGQIYVSETVSTRLLDGLSGKASSRAASPIEKLTDRELEVFTLIGQAKETKEIAQRLHMSTKTVEAHRGSIKRKLKLKSGPELTRHAVLWVEATR